MKKNIFRVAPSFLIKGVKGAEVVSDFCGNFRENCESNKKVDRIREIWGKLEWNVSEIWRKVARNLEKILKFNRSLKEMREKGAY